MEFVGIQHRLGRSCTSARTILIELLHGRRRHAPVCAPTPDHARPGRGYPLEHVQRTQHAYAGVVRLCVQPARGRCPGDHRGHHASALATGDSRHDTAQELSGYERHHRNTPPGQGCRSRVRVRLPGTRDQRRRWCQRASQPGAVRSVHGAAGHRRTGCAAGGDDRNCRAAGSTWWATCKFARAAHSLLTVARAVRRRLRVRGRRRPGLESPADRDKCQCATVKTRSPLTRQLEEGIQHVDILYVTRTLAGALHEQRRCRPVPWTLPRQRRASTRRHGESDTVIMHPHCHATRRRAGAGTRRVRSTRTPTWPSSARPTTASWCASRCSTIGARHRR